MSSKFRINLPPKTPIQMNFDLMNQQFAVNQCPDEVLDDQRFGLCIRQTRYRTKQEDRVSITDSKFKI